MKIIALVRTRNEEKNIARFCKAFSWADKILVADGGSEDRTKEVALTFPNVEVRDYTVRRQMKNGLWRNPEGDHINFLVDWAKEYDPDWVLMDDCDCVPNKYLQQGARKMLEETTLDHAYVVRIFLWRGDTHFKEAAQPCKPGKWEAGMWGWRMKKVDMKFRDSQHAFECNIVPPVNERLEFLPPYCDLHYTWTDDSIMIPKIQFYNDSGQIPGLRPPLEQHSPPVPTEDWMILE